ncbi:hypothetical protein EV363DRAFT_1293945 [Boletus edulis]|nr:hypothetical protein EV363DRAFT_1293945 [Boletus edulis]
MFASFIKASSQDIKFDEAGESESSRPVQTCNTPSHSGSVEPTTTSTTTKAPPSTKSNSSTIPDATQDVAASDLSLSSSVVRSVMVPLLSSSFCQPPSHARGTHQDSRQPPLTGTPSAVGAICVRNSGTYMATPLRNVYLGSTPGSVFSSVNRLQSLLGKRHILTKLDSDCLDSDTSDAEPGAKMEEHTMTGNLYKRQAQETDIRLEVAETKLRSIWNSIQMGGGTLCDFSSQKHLRTSHDMLAVTNQLLPFVFSAILTTTFLELLWTCCLHCVLKKPKHRKLEGVIPKPKSNSSHANEVKEMEVVDEGSHMSDSESNSGSAET